MSKDTNIIDGHQTAEDRFNRINDELIERYFTDDIRDKIRQYVNGTYTSPNLPPEITGLGEYSDRDLLAELVNRGVIDNIIGENHGSDLNDYELVNSLNKMYEWGIGSGRKLASGVIKRIDDRNWDMIASRLDQFEQTFSNRERRLIYKRVKKLLKEEK